MLDRLSLLAPGWSERSAADVGVMLVELLAYAADNLSYRQDAIANEAYLATARQRVSVRRHARLVDYPLHDGCNARAWVQVDGARRTWSLPRGTPLLTRSGAVAGGADAAAARRCSDALAAGAIVFETAHDGDAVRRPATQLSFYTWGDDGCCLPRGATRATLRGAHPDARGRRRAGVRGECVSPTHLRARRCRPRQRWAVRLTDGDGGRRSVGSAVRPTARRTRRWTSPRSPGTRPTRCRSRCACRCKSGRASRSAWRSATSCSSITARPCATSRWARCPSRDLRRVAAAAGAQSCHRAEGEPIPARFRPALASAPLTQGFDLASDLRRSAHARRRLVAGELR